MATPDAWTRDQRLGAKHHKSLVRRSEQRNAKARFRPFVGAGGRRPISSRRDFLFKQAEERSEAERYPAALYVIMCP